MIYTHLGCISSDLRSRLRRLRCHKLRLHCQLLQLLLLQETSMKEWLRLQLQQGRLLLLEYCLLQLLVEVNLEVPELGILGLLLLLQLVLLDRPGLRVLELLLLLQLVLLEGPELRVLEL